MPTDPTTGHETLCAKCGKPEREHCSFDEPGHEWDCPYEWDCPLMHHEFKAASPGPVPE